VGAQSRGEVRDWANCAVVIASFEANPAERRVTSLDPDSQSQLDAALAPDRGEFAEVLLRSEREPDRLQLVIAQGQRVVEEDHHAVAGEMLERPFMCRDQLTERRVVVTKNAEVLFRGCRLGERRETP